MSIIFLELVMVHRFSEVTSFQHISGDRLALAVFLAKRDVSKLYSGILDRDPLTTEAMDNSNIEGMDTFYPSKVLPVLMIIFPVFPLYSIRQ